MLVAIEHDGWHRDIVYIYYADRFRTDRRFRVYVAAAVVVELTDPDT